MKGSTCTYASLTLDEPLFWLLGFGTTLTVAYGTTEPKYNTLAAAMRVLVTPADLRLTVS